MTILRSISSYSEFDDSQYDIEMVLKDSDNITHTVCVAKSGDSITYKQLKELLYQFSMVSLDTWSECNSCKDAKTTKGDPSYANAILVGNSFRDRPMHRVGYVILFSEQIVTLHVKRPRTVL